MRQVMTQATWARCRRPSQPSRAASPSTNEERATSERPGSVIKFGDRPRMRVGITEAHNTHARALKPLAAAGPVFAAHRPSTITPDPQPVQTIGCGGCALRYHFGKVDQILETAAHLVKSGCRGPRASVVSRERCCRPAARLAGHLNALRPWPPLPRSPLRHAHVTPSFLWRRRR
jgi:hypothetical protein